jgi:HSP20 family molecular chaperone IbpA
MASEIFKPIVSPDVSVSHGAKDEGLVVEVELPGINKKDIDLTVSTNSFCVSAEREDVKYEGCFQFAHEVNKDLAKAKFENGLLKLSVPFKEPLRGTKVEIE